MKRRLKTSALILACGMIAAMPAAAQLTGTLFTSPEQREYLDYLRQEFLASSSERGFDIDEAEIPEIPEAVAEAEAEAGPVVYTLGGIVSLRDGTQRIWLNGKALSESELPGEARLVRDNGMLVLRFSTANGTYLLRPGQTLELTAGSVVENYQRSVDEAEAEHPESLTEGEELADAADAEATPSEAALDPTSLDASENAVTEPAATPPTQESIEDLRKLLDTLQAPEGSSDG